MFGDSWLCARVKCEKGKKRWLELQGGEWVLLANASLWDAGTGALSIIGVCDLGLVRFCIDIASILLSRVDSWLQLAESQVVRRAEGHSGAGCALCLCHVSHNPEDLCFTPSKDLTPSFLLG